ncbi:MAG TPA: mannosyltransferase family protein [Solirubrobacteraceae bacterium]|nr:mannosyltransferase family protein [Solirubrobacteraceae bacterium]
MRPLGQDVRASALAFAGSRLLVWIAGAGAFLVAGNGPERKFDFLGLTGHLGTVGDVLAAPVVRWDAIWYLHIAEHGYPHTTEAAYFPLYPLLVHVVGFVTRSDVIAATLVSLVAFFVALVALHRLTELELGAAAARRTVVLLAFFPAAVFFSAAYTESLFLALSVGVLLAARRERWAVAGGLGALAAATRSAGVLLILPALMMYLSQRSPGGRRWRPDAAWLLLIPCGLGAFLLASQLMLGDAFATVHAQDHFHRAFAGPFSGVWRGFDESGHALSAIAGGHVSASALRKIALLLTALGALCATVGVFRRLGVAYGAYAVLALAAGLSTPQAGHPLSSSPRYILIVFPLFMWLGALLEDRRAFAAVASLFAIGLAYCSALFATWHFVA